MARHLFDTDWYVMQIGRIIFGRWPPFVLKIGTVHIDPSSSHTNPGQQTTLLTYQLTSRTVMIAAPCPQHCTESDSALDLVTRQGLHNDLDSLDYISLL